MYAWVSHYIHLIQQGKSHEDALAHCTQRYGISSGALLGELQRAWNRHNNALLALSHFDISQVG